MKHFDPDFENGLSAQQVADRQQAGLTNKNDDPPTKPISRILRDNLLTLFNFINIALALVVVATGHYKNMLFMLVIIINTTIGIVQEIRAKRAIDKLSLLSAASVRVIRDGKVETVTPEQVVLDEVIEFSSGSRICADCTVLWGECEVNEAFLTGESDLILKKSGDTVLAGSFVASGICRARADKISGNTFVASISRDAKQEKKQKSEIMSSLNSILKLVSAIIIPLGAVLFYSQMRLGVDTWQDAAVSVVAALIGMIPEGLILLTSTVLSVSIVRLSQKNILVKDLYSIESLARVDVICLDKTGTLTDGKLTVNEIIPLSDKDEAQIKAILAMLCGAAKTKNATLEAIEAFAGKATASVINEIPFNSERKWSAVSFENGDTYILGAPDILCPLRDWQGEFSARTALKRTLLLAKPADKNAVLNRDTLIAVTPVALITLTDTMRKNVAQTMDFFTGEGVSIKVISGDAPHTVSAIAAAANVPDYDKYVDASELSSQELDEAVRCHTVFGRVTPQRKKELVCALQKQGHTVAMTGDGVNDVLALRQADCSIAMAEGSEAARNISHLVLQSCDFSALPAVVADGRQSINNIKRSASLFLVKTVYSLLLAFAFLFISEPYPFIPIQLTLLSTFTIGIPSVILALETNHNRLIPGFFAGILKKAIPAGLAVAAAVLCAVFIGTKSQLTSDDVSAICVLAAGVIGLINLWRICMPLTKIKSALALLMSGAFFTAYFIFSDFFSLTALTTRSALTSLICMAIGTIIYILTVILAEKIKKK